MTPISVPAKLLAMSSMALCSPEYMKPLQPTATVRRTMAVVGWSPVKEAPSRARAGPMVAMVFAIFLMTVVRISFLSMMVSTRMEPPMETNHIAR